jgi:general secretion pathway protein G
MKRIHLGHLRRRRHSVALSAAHRGLTLLEILIVIAILGTLIAIIVPRLFGAKDKADRDLAKLAVDQWAFKDVPMWQATNSKGCPESLLTVAQSVGKGQSDITDPWGTPYEMFCGANLPPGAQGVAVMSYGPDKKKGTEDDIKSWETNK